MSILPRLCLVSVLAAVVTPLSLQAATDPTYAALRGAKPDGRKIPVQNLVLERDAFRFQLDSGALHLLAPVDRRTVGAVFVGQGSYRLTPAKACVIVFSMEKRASQAAIPAAVLSEWEEEFEAAARRPLKSRLRYAFVRTYKPVLDDAPYRSFSTTAEYRAWCAENLPDWLGYGPAV